MSTVPVLYSFARSGGTLVNQLLGVHPDCLVLSEVNPAASYKPVAEQAVEWLGLVALDEAPGFARRPYREQLAELHRRAAERGKRLVVRDWVTVNFLPGTAGSAAAPSGELEQALYLERAGLEPLAVVVTRAAEAVYRSIRRSFAHLRELDRDAFAIAYLAYAKRVAHLPRVSLEALRQRPPEAVARLLEMLQLRPVDPRSLLDRFADFTRCTGNNSLADKPASASARTVLPAEADGSGANEAHPAFAEADRMLGYGT